MSSLCFSSVIFRANLPFLPAFLDSLQNQTDVDFTLVLFNDGVQDLESFFENYKLPYMIVEVVGSITQIRENMLCYLKKSGFHYTVFGDTDDFFSDNRVAINREELKKYDIVGNDVWLVNEAGEDLCRKYWDDRVEELQPISYSSLRNCNFLGLGNTAVKNSIIPQQIYFPDDLVALDWYLFSILLKQGATCTFTSDTYINYRQHGNNIIGLKELTLHRFQYEVTVKRKHYNAMAKVDPSYKVMAEQYKLFERKVEALSELQLDRYIKQKNHPFWWEEVEL